MDSMEMLLPYQLSELVKLSFVAYNRRFLSYEKSHARRIHKY